MTQEILITPSMNDSKIRQSNNDYGDMASVEFFFTTNKKEEYIIRSTRRPDLQFEMIVHKTSGAKMQRMVFSSPVLEGSYGSPLFTLASPDGKYIAYTYAGEATLEEDRETIFEAYIYEIVDHSDELDRCEEIKSIPIIDSELTKDERFDVVSLKLHKYVRIPNWLDD